MDAANIGLSEKMHTRLREMTDNDIFSEMKDGYRLAASLAMRQGLQVDDRQLENRQNMYDVGGVDEDFIFRNAISVIYPDQSGKEYKYLEKLADSGMEILYSHYNENGDLELASMFADDP